jgi:hypothetical protein
MANTMNVYGQPSTSLIQKPADAFCVLVRTAREPQELLKSLEGKVHRIDPDILTFDDETMEDWINQS